MTDNNNDNDNDSWLEKITKTKSITTSRNCGHCHLPGHTINQCAEVKKLADRMFDESLYKLHQNPRGYTLEKFIYSLTVPYLKIMYKKMCGKTMRKKEESIIQEILDEFRLLNIGYIGRKERCSQLYSGAFHAASIDNACGHTLQNYLDTLSFDETKELFDKFYAKNWIGQDTELAERNDYKKYYVFMRSMSPHHYHIHCHFSEMDIGYTFKVFSYFRHMHHPIRAVLNTSNTLLKMVHLSSNYIKCLSLEKSKMDDVEVDCAVCMNLILPSKLVKFNCNHIFCGVCVAKVMNGTMKSCKDLSCPLCRTSVSKLVFNDDSILIEMREIIVE